MPETVNSCPLCGSNQSSPFDQRQFREYTVTNRLCSHCGLVYQSPRMTGQELDAFYQAEYRRLYQQQEGPDPKDLAVQAGRAEALSQFVKSHVPEVHSHLDIGCSAGLLLGEFQETYECRSAGIEPGDAYRKYARSKGLTIYSSLDELQTKTSGTESPLFDLISMAHVLEHLPDPVGYLGILREQFLSPAGWLLIEVPNLYCHDCFEVAHLVSYSPHTLSQTLRKAGYEVHTSTQHGQPRSAILPLYLTVIGRQIADPSHFKRIPENGVARKRRFGLLKRRISTRLTPQRAWIPASKMSTSQD